MYVCDSTDNLVLDAHDNLMQYNGSFDSIGLFNNDVHEI